MMYTPKPMPDSPFPPYSPFKPKLSHDTTTRTTATRPSTTVKCVVMGAADAGKTSLLRRYFLGTFSSSRVPTAGSDFYTKKITIQLEPDEEADDESDEGQTESEKPKQIQQPVFLQAFDTPGKTPIRRGENQELHRQNLLQAFAGRVDGVLLVYDMTSSTSFNQLRQWYTQWARQNSLNQQSQQDSQRDIPILIVGNKQDLLPNSSLNKDKSGKNKPRFLPTIPPRDVMHVGDFKGKDFRYEYRVDHQIHPHGLQQDNHHHSSSNASMNNHSGRTTPVLRCTSPPAGSTHNHHHHHHHHHSSNNKANKRHHAVSTFSNTADGTWTEDGTYLDSLLGTEDRSNPDVDMVKLWCMRNGLQHLEVSAANNDNKTNNVQEAVELLVRQVLEYRREKERQQHNLTHDQNGQRQVNHHHHHHQQQPIATTSAFTSLVSSSTATQPPVATMTKDIIAQEKPPNYFYQPNPKLDLLQRYQPKERKCCFGLLPTLPTLVGRFTATGANPASIDSDTTDNNETVIP